MFAGLSWRTIAKAVLTVLDIIRTVLDAVERSKAKQEGRDGRDLEAHHEADRISDAIADSRDRMPDYADDPYNRDNSRNPVS